MTAISKKVRAPDLALMKGAARHRHAHRLRRDDGGDYSIKRASICCWSETRWDTSFSDWIQQFP